MTTNKYRGSCHCGDVKYSVSIDLENAARCNCSICTRAGWLLAFVPESDFKLETSMNKLNDYQFGKKVIHHYFCKRCGVRSFGKGILNGAPLCNINLRCLEDTDISDLPIVEYDGAAL